MKTIRQRCSVLLNKQNFVNKTGYIRCEHTGEIMRLFTM